MEPGQQPALEPESDAANDNGGDKRETPSPTLLTEDELDQAKSQLKPYGYKIGGSDNDSACIEKIYAKTLSHIVYRTDRSIRVDIDDEHANSDVLAERHYKLSADLARIYSLLPETLSKTESINRLVGRAIAANLAGYSDAGKEILAQAEERLVKLKIIQGRLQYTASALVLVFIVFIISIFNGLSTAPILVNVALLGSLGGVLSIALGFSSLEIDLDASATVNCLIGCSRILIAIAAAIFSYFAIQTDVAFSFVEKAPDNSGFYMIAMISGFVEMLIPNIMSNLASNGAGDRGAKAET